MNDSRSPAWIALAGALAASAMLLPACSSKTAYQLGFGSGAKLAVQRTLVRGPYLDSELMGEGITFHTYTLADEACGAVLVPEREVEFVDRGWGRFVRGEASCDAAGIGQRQITSGRRPRGGNPSSTPVPRAQATFRLLYEDEDLQLLRGMFPLASLIGWAGGADTVAVVGSDPTCRSATRAGVASMEYRASGRNTLSLVGSSGLCPIIGLIRPPPGG
jgi:hypothetical protein